jgi:hypothetical protein
MDKMDFIRTQLLTHFSSLTIEDYFNDPLFHGTIESLVQGQHPLKLIEELIINRHSLLDKITDLEGIITEMQDEKLKRSKPSHGLPYL